MDKVCQEGSGLQHLFSDGGFVGVTSTQIYAREARQAAELAADSAATLILCWGKEGRGLIDVWLTEGVEDAAYSKYERSGNDDPLAPPKRGEKFAEVYFIVWIMLVFWCLTHHRFPTAAAPRAIW